MIIGVILLIIHLLLCVAVFFLIAMGMLKVRMEVMPLVIFVPLWGVVCVMLIHFQLLLAGKYSASIGVEKLRINEEIYRSFLVPDEDSKGVAPLEDVLLLDEAKTRRKQMMELLNDNPVQYLELLRQARMNSDVEVVHYATTAMSELNKEYDLKLQKAEKNYGDNPESPERLDEYLEVLGDYLDKALAPERIQKIQRQQYAMLLQKRQNQRPELQNGVELERQLLRLGEFEQAENVLKELEQKWPSEQQIWLLKVEYAARQKNGRQIRRILREAEEKHIYFTTQTRESLEFWQKESEE